MSSDREYQLKTEIFLKKNQMEILKLKSIMTKVKILLERSNGRFELTKERINGLEGRLIVILESKD